MALQNEMNYASKVTYGSVAYDIDRTNAAPALAEEQEREVVRLKTRKAVSVQYEETKQGLSIFAVIGYCVLFTLLLAVLLSCVQLTQVQAQRSRLNKQLATLQEENVQLVIKYENNFNLADVEDYAVNVLGMSKAVDSQITRLNDTKTDKAVILADGSTSEGKGLFSTILTSVMEYFR